jgi:hypothetical protein
LDTKEDFYLPEEVVEWIGQKKSEYLSRLIELVTEDDLGFEDYHEFEHLIPDTVKEADRVFEEEIDAETVRTFVRTYAEKGGFHQIVLGALIPDTNSNAQVFVPILSFVTVKDELVREFLSGEAVSRPTLN